METIENVIEDMRYAARLYLQGGVEGRAQFEMLDSYADRLDAAHKREIKSIVDANEIAMKTAMDEVAKIQTSLAESAKTLDEYREENARLKAALKPVLECDIKNTVHVCEHSIRSVIKAKRIYNGGEK